MDACDDSAIAGVVGQMSLTTLSISTGQFTELRATTFAYLLEFTGIHAVAVHPGRTFFVS